MKPKYILFLGGLVLAATPLPAQPAAGATDPDWAAVKNLGRGKSGSANPAADLIGDANRLRDFYTQHPDHPEAKNAKCLEGLALVRAWLAGDASQQTRRERVVAEVRGDKSVAATLRVELVGLADHVAIGKKKGLSRDARLLAYEQVERSLIAEFPALPNGYEGLLGLAHDSAEPRGSALAGELVRMTAAPAAVKAGARIVQARCALVGRSLAELTTPLVGAADPLAKPGAVWVYSWSAASAMSLGRAKALAVNAPAAATIVGVCLDDQNLDAARARAAAEKLPGAQVYSDQGARSPLARKLVLSEPGLIYATDEAGVVRSVTAQHALEPRLAMIGR